MKNVSHIIYGAAFMCGLRSRRTKGGREGDVKFEREARSLLCTPATQATDSCAELSMINFDFETRTDSNCVPRSNQKQTMRDFCQSRLVKIMGIIKLISVFTLLGLVHNKFAL